MNYRDEQYKGKISPEKAQRMLKKEGMNVTVELAEEILYFLRKVANIQIQHFLEKNDKKKKG
ncbi:MULTISPECIES: hypothetical protein [Flavobacterium]|uniref:Uncharacterized protein n=2 Tax=Flavobacterium TaxID=237 RepID=A0A521BM95_9FLAO|nr:MULTISPECIES: hypothetical protein [Flavobacterium]KAF2330861.1 hypothetical protein DM397_13795 [Flavobacterium nitrogenifigens]WDF65550.1 hypothetical protein PQ463_05150 [Flavobacterium sp. KACC 22763]SMO48274.1 hypothetical protein SAMN06265220_1011127 [Flavobacterium nitrogenifigens]